MIEKSQDPEEIFEYQNRLAVIELNIEALFLKFSYSSSIDIFLEVTLFFAAGGLALPLEETRDIYK